MKVSRKGVRFCSRWEGFRSCPYKIGSDPWTIGYGETQGIGPNTPCISERKARKMLRTRISRDYLPSVPRLNRLKKRERDGLASFAYNCGTGAVSDPDYSTLADRLQSPEGRTYAGRCRIYREELPRWVMPGSQFEQGLRKRRAAEVALLTKGTYSGRP